MTAENIREIHSLVSQLFSKKWAALPNDPKVLSDKELKSPGVYLLAFSEKNLIGKPVRARDVFYVGMSNSSGGVQQRLKQFVSGIEKNGLHSGAMRFFREYANHHRFSESHLAGKFYYVAHTIKCISDKSKSHPSDFRKMGHIACAEYYAIAHIEDETGRRPRLNKLGNEPTIPAA